MLIMRAVTVHVPLLSWQNQSAHAANALKQVAVTSQRTAPAPPQLPLLHREQTQENQFGEDGIFFFLFAFYQNVTYRHQPGATSFTYLLISRALLQIIISELMNYGVRPHRVLLSPRINLSDFGPAVRMDFLLNDSMRKNYNHKFEANTSCYDDLLL